MSRVEEILTKLGIKFERIGKRLWASCPFHVDRKPSWFIREGGERSGQHHCFSCKAGGHLIDLVMQVRSMSRPDAEVWLSHYKLEEPDYVELPSTEVFRMEVENVGNAAFTLPKEFVTRPFDAWVTGARRYVEGRGITAGQVTRWGMGYAVTGRLRGRVIIPIYGLDGRAKNYMARTFTNADARYINARMEENPDLDVLFGEAQWKPRGTVVVTEGAIDAMACERVLPSTVSIAAIGGSNIRPLHMAKLTRFERVIVFMDNDIAGNKAAPIIDGSLARTRTQVVRVTLPPGSDPASVSPEVLRERLWQTLEAPGATLLS